MENIDLDMFFMKFNTAKFIRTVQRLDSHFDIKITRNVMHSNIL